MKTFSKILIFSFFLLTLSNQSVRAEKPCTVNGSTIQCKDTDACTSTSNAGIIAPYCLVPGAKCETSAQICTCLSNGVPGFTCGTGKECYVEKERSDGGKNYGCRVPDGPADTGTFTMINPFDRLQVALPGIKFTGTSSIKCDKDADGKTTSCEYPWIGEYIAWLYRYSVGIAGILATIVIMFAGFRWMMSAGDSSAVGEAKKYIEGAVAGLVILMTSYIILFQVNPNLTIMKPLKIGIVQEEPIPESFTSGGGTGGGTGNVTTTMNDSLNAAFGAAIKTAATANGVDCNLIKAVIFAESSGNQNAKSPVGAQGLMQIMPKTAAGLGCSSGCNMFDGNNAVKYGTKYLKELKSTACNGSKISKLCSVDNLENVIAAYNGGPGANKISDQKCPGQIKWKCENIKGYEETRNYVQKVKANYEKVKTMPGC